MTPPCFSRQQQAAVCGVENICRVKVVGLIIRNESFTESFASVTADATSCHVSLTPLAEL